MSDKKLTPKAIQLLCPGEINIAMKKLQLEREEKGFVNDEGKKETLKDIMILLLQRGLESFK